MKYFSVRWSLVLGLCVIFGMFLTPTYAETEIKHVSIVVRDECKHCHDALDFFDTLQTKRNDYELHIFNIGNETGKNIFEEVTEKNNLVKTTPIINIGNVLLQGFDTQETTGETIKKILDDPKTTSGAPLDVLLKNTTPLKKHEISWSTCDETSLSCSVEDQEKSYEVHIPFIGKVDVLKYSMPAMAFILGFIDGFNPCAMWVLIMFLMALLQVGDRKKMWQMAGIFIFAETIMYYLILTVWFTTWDFIGIYEIVTPLVGILSLGGGIFFLYEYWTYDGTCKVTSLEQQRSMSKKIQEFAAKPFTIISAIGIIGLAFSVNVIEFACSIGIPQAFTKILEMNNFDPLYRQFLMFMYILAYMIDDFIVFGIALYGSEKLHLSSKYARYCTLIGGVLMLILGYLLIFDPSKLVLF